MDVGSGRKEEDDEGKKKRAEFCDVMWCGVMWEEGCFRGQRVRRMKMVKWRLEAGLCGVS